MYVDRCMRHLAWNCQVSDSSVLCILVNCQICRYSTAYSGTSDIFGLLPLPQWCAIHHTTEPVPTTSGLFLSILIWFRLSLQHQVVDKPVTVDTAVHCWQQKSMGCHHSRGVCRVPPTTPERHTNFVSFFIISTCSLSLQGRSLAPRLFTNLSRKMTMNWDSAKVMSSTSSVESTTTGTRELSEDALDSFQSTMSRSSLICPSNSDRHPLIYQTAHVRCENLLELECLFFSLAVVWLTAAIWPNWSFVFLWNC